MPEPATSQEELENRLRDYIERLEKWTPPRSYPEMVLTAQKGGREAEEASRDHWMQTGMGEAYDTVIENLYSILGEDW